MGPAFRAARQVLSRLEDGGDAFDGVNVNITYQGASRELATAVVQGFPELSWQAAPSGSTDWVSAEIATGVQLTVFLATEPEPPKLAQQILDEAGQ